VSPTTSTSRTNAFILVTSMRLGVPMVLSQHADEHRLPRTSVAPMSLDWRAGVDLAIERLGIVLTVLVALVGTAIFLLIAFVVGSALVELVT
jgi:hypothetical protein